VKFVDRAEGQAVHSRCNREESMRLLTLLAIAATATACTMQTTPPMGRASTDRAPRGGDAGTDEATEPGGDAVLASVADESYQTSHDFAHATKAPFPSTVAAGSSIDAWVTMSAWADYAKIAPDVTGSGVKVAPGTIIVRAVLDKAGTTTKLTLMAKGPPGYNPDLGDWWFGETDPYGAPLTTDAGALTGRLTECYSCHIPRAKDDYLFGVPSTYRAQ
jgi:hypothetical protein